ncbi:MAG TPA: hypothetical protein VF892_17110 [Pseudonocardiaceae bacterium]
MTIRGTGDLDLLDSLELTLREALPADWTLIARRQPTVGDPRPDMLLHVAAPDGTTATVLVEVKRQAEPRHLAAILQLVRRLSGQVGADAAIVATPFVSPTTRMGLAQAGVGWFDATGNVRFRASRPAVFVDRVGADRNPFTDPADRRLKSLRGPAAARVVRALCAADLPLGVRSVAQQANVSIGSSSRVLDLLTRDGLVARGDLAEVVMVRKRSLVRRWTEDYGLTTSNVATPVLDPRGLDHAVAELRSAGTAYAVTGSLAARAYLPAGTVPVTPLGTLTVHTGQPYALIEELGLRPVDRGANVFVVQPFDEDLLRGSRDVDGLHCAAPAQVVADLLTGPGRSSEEAEQLIRVLAATDQGWTE